MNASSRTRLTRRRRRPFRALLIIFLLIWAALAIYQANKPLPQGFSVEGPLRPANDLAILIDQTYVSAAGEQVSEQEIFDEIFRLIEQARQLVVVDMFLFNEFASENSYRPLTEQLTSALLKAQNRNTDIQVLLITDPFNHLYGGLEAAHLQQLSEAGVQVISTDVNRLPASNPLWSGFWQLCCSLIGNSTEGGWLPNPVGDGKVTLRTYLRLLNFRANHRKTLVVDQGDDWVGLVTSANPHDASSQHTNSAIRFSGPAALDLLETERAVLAMSGRSVGASWPEPPAAPATSPADAVQVLTEGAIQTALLDMIETANPGNRLDIEVFYLSSRQIIDALIEAHGRGALVRVLLDPNRDAFGRKKIGIPNRQAAWDLHKEGIEVRWCHTEGEQCHRKWVRRDGPEGQAELIVGSANFTRRNLDNLNLETSVRVVSQQGHPAIDTARSQFEQAWMNADGKQYSLPYKAFADHSQLKYVLYRVMEATGMSSF
ncbi:MAG TPA: phospholipase [Pseudomonas xinjiangensis]|uniref:phospholipase D n=2 Tax=root TaxID=1 RepID=A0A7V1FR43_9GAMM|nr:phospholipase [Halopseudomonas xinjiangensis]HEC46104.1 phospholipase [Halopseudomonas xinjiangensis]